MDEFNKLKELVEGCADDLEKAEKGNKSAGTRIRKAMQDIKKQAQEVRQAILKKREDS